MKFVPQGVWTRVRFFGSCEQNWSEIVMVKFSKMKWNLFSEILMKHFDFGKRIKNYFCLFFRCSINIYDYHESLGGKTRSRIEIGRCKALEFWRFSQRQGQKTFFWLKWKIWKQESNMIEFSKAWQILIIRRKFSKVNCDQFWASQSEKCLYGLILGFLTINCC